MLTKTFSIKLRNNEFITITRNKTINNYTNDYNIIKDNIISLFNENYNNKEIRLIGCGVLNLIKIKDYTKDYNLFLYLNY